MPFNLSWRSHGMTVVRRYHDASGRSRSGKGRRILNMAQGKPVQLANRANQRVLAYLADKSAHSDIADVLLDAVHPLGDVQMFCPDHAAYRYVIASTNGIVFGFAAGMSTVAFRLDARMRRRALATGGVACPDCGEEWIAVVHPLPDSDWPAVDVRFWARQAYVHARETLPAPGSRG